MKSIVLLLLLTLIVTGCMGARQDFPIQYYSLNTKPDITITAKNIPASLWIQEFTSSPRYNPAFLYKTNLYEIRYQETNRWVERPEAMVTKLFTHFYSNSDVFESVTSGGIPKPADYTLEGHITAFDQIRDEDGWRAEYSVRLTLSKTIERTVVWSETLSFGYRLEQLSAFHHTDALSKAAAESAKQSLEKIVTIF